MINKRKIGKTDIEVSELGFGCAPLGGWPVAVSDQDAKSKGVFVDFFRTPASTPKGAALFHINTRAPLLLGVCFKENFKKYHIHFKAINTKNKNLKEITQEYTSQLESYIKQYPDQYFWFHRRWKTKKT